MTSTEADREPHSAVAPKLTLIDHQVRPEHRSGWRDAIDALRPLSTPNGVLADTFVEATFAWPISEGRADAVVPYRVPWVGFLHNPVNIPDWHDSASSPRVVFGTAAWTASMPACRGIVTLSRHLASWVAARLDVPVVPLMHPTGAPTRLFSMDRFVANPRRELVQIGWWLRRLHSIGQLELDTLRPAILEPLEPTHMSRFAKALERERAALSLSVDMRRVRRITYQSPAAYDALLSENIVFLHLFDSSANNAIVECIVRHTPVVVNRLPAVEEYLGPGYPLYFETLEDAARKAEDLGRVAAANAYLAEVPKDVFTGAHFRRSLAESELYRSL